MRRNNLTTIFASAALYVFLYAPIAVVILYSFNAARYGIGWGGFTLRWYSELRQNSVALAAARNTVLLAFFSTAIATTLGTLLGFGLQRYQFPAKRLFSRLLYIPIFIPDIVLAVALLLFYSLVRTWVGLFELGLASMTVAHVTFQIPFVAIVVRSRMLGLDPILEEAARDLGASAFQSFWHVTFPLILPGIIAAAMLAFTLSLDDFVVSFFTSGPGSTTLPILIYSSVKRGITPDMNALATLIIVASVAGTVLLTLFQRSKRLHY